MNKSIIKKFATEARRQLQASVTQQLLRLNLEEPNKLPTTFTNGQEIEDVRFKEGRLKDQRTKLISRYQEIGRERLVEEVAYFWFNRLLALRFMEVNGYLDTNTKVLAPKSEQYKEPQLLTDATKVNLPVDQDQVYQYQQENDREGLYRYLLITQCNQLHQQLPFLFEATDDYTELLMPQNLLSPNSVIHQLVELVPEEDFKEVEIIGWMYQYYISEKKDELIHAKKKYKTEDIPKVTQLFTPHWIVKYMVQNSLGRYWIESHPEHVSLKSNWDFYIESRDKESIEKVKDLENQGLNIEKIKVYDPAMGSGHILVYAFEVLYQIYTKLGYQQSNIPKLILKNNLFGLDIDQRAAQLAQFSLVMKAKQYDTDILNNDVDLNLKVIEDSQNISNEEITALAGESSGIKYDKIKDFISQFKNAKTLGSIIKVKQFDEEVLSGCLSRVKESPQLFTSLTYGKFQALVRQYSIMNQVFDITVANPPYIGSKYMNLTLSTYVRENYPDTKGDLFAVFIEMMLEHTKQKGHLGFMSPFVWMFIKSYENFRKTLVSEKSISSLVQLEYNSFESAAIPICLYTCRNNPSSICGEYIKLSEYKGSHQQPIKIQEAIKNPKVKYRFTSNMSKYSNIPGCPIIYWFNNKLIDLFRDATLKQIADIRQGMSTADNKRFIRFWNEVNISNINFYCQSRNETFKSTQSWYPHAKGGEYRKWYGNYENLVLFRNDGEEIKKFVSGQYPYLNGNTDYVVKNLDFFFRSGITWTSITMSKPSFRYLPDNFTFNMAGSSMFVYDQIFQEYLISLLNTKIFAYILDGLNPTMNNNVYDFERVPFLKDMKNLEEINSRGSRNIQISKLDWDSYELSWNFSSFPILNSENHSLSIKQSYDTLRSQWQKMTHEVKQLEEENNKIFIDAYGLQDELTPEVPLEEITLTCNPHYRYKGDKSNDELEALLLEDTVKEFISYAVGCMMGRYSLDKPGLILANQGDGLKEYLEQVPKPTFMPDEDGIIPVLDEEYFKEDDILLRFNEFVRVTFGKEKFSENLSFIAHALGGSRNKTPDEVLRHYFTNKFYKDHVKMYKKRPIYWLFKSGMHNAFSALVYLHRYTPDTIATIRTRYVHKLQNKYSALLEQTQSAKQNTQTASEISKLDKKIVEYKAKIKELGTYEQQLKHFADQRIKLDLDDGVEHNYQLLEDLLEKR